MGSFFHNLPLAGAIEIEQLARLMYEVRTARQNLLANNAVADENELLQRIANGAVTEHPVYEQYLSAHILGNLLDDIRADLSRRLAAANAGTPVEAAAPASLHLALASEVANRFGEHLQTPPEVKLDALLLHLDNGVSIEARFAAADAYSLAWVWGNAELRIDTAPRANAADATGAHWHNAEGARLAAPLTRCGDTPWNNLCALLDTLLADPLLAAVMPNQSVRVELVETPAPKGE